MSKVSVVRNERGSIPIFMVVMMVVSGLVLVTVQTVDSGLRSTRRAGDSANALQVADAGVNDAIQQAPTVPATTSSFTRSGSLGSSGTYTYTATRDPVRTQLWHVDVLGTDSSGLRRRVKADAIPASLFNTPLFVNSTLDLHAGVSLDSYSSGVNAAAMCTGKGILGTNEPDTMTFGTSGKGVGVTNCQKRLGLNPAWDYSMDGCTSYGDGSQSLPPIGSGKCPPDPNTYKTPPRRYSAPRVYAPGSTANPTPPHFSGTTLTCDLAQPATTDPNPNLAVRNVHSLVGGKIYYYSTAVTLRAGCGVSSPVISSTGTGIDIDKPVYVYSDGRVDIGNPNGLGGKINMPPAGDATVCGATASSAQLDGTLNPAHYYCPLWSAGLRIRMVSGAGGAANGSVVNIRSSGTKFWGAIEVPTGSLTLSGSQVEVWGAAASNTARSSAQFTWHFDDALANISTGQYGLTTWREEGLA